MESKILRYEIHTSNNGDGNLKAHRGHLRLICIAKIKGTR